MITPFTLGTIATLQDAANFLSGLNCPASCKAEVKALKLKLGQAFIEKVRERPGLSTQEMDILQIQGLASAVNAYKARTGMGLVESKQVVDLYAKGEQTFLDLYFL